MPGNAQKQARRRKQNRLAQQRRRASQPKPEPKDGDEPFDMPETAPPVVIPQPPSKTYTPDKTEADAMLAEAAAIPPPKYDPLIFNTATDPNRPSWFPPTEIKLAVHPLKALLHPPIEAAGQQFTPAKEVRFTYSAADGHRDRLRDQYESDKAAERVRSRGPGAWPARTNGGSL